MGENTPEVLLDTAAEVIADRRKAADDRLDEIVKLQAENKRLSIELCILKNPFVPRNYTYAWDFAYQAPAPFLFGGTQSASNTASGAKYGGLKITEADNIVCQMETLVPKASGNESLQQKIDRIVAYFAKRAKENGRRATEDEKHAFRMLTFEEHEQKDRSSYYFSGKADSYSRAAAKVKEILG